MNITSFCHIRKTTSNLKICPKQSEFSSQWVTLYRELFSQRGCFIWGEMCVLTVFSFCFVLFWDKASCSLGYPWIHYIAKDDLGLPILLPLPLEYWDRPSFIRSAEMISAYHTHFHLVLWIKTRASCMLGKRYTNWVTLLVPWRYFNSNNTMNNAFNPPKKDI